MAIEKKHVTLKFKLNEDGSMKMIYQGPLDLPPGTYTAVIEVDDSEDMPPVPEDENNGA